MNKTIQVKIAFARCQSLNLDMKLPNEWFHCGSNKVIESDCLKGLNFSIELHRVLAFSEPFAF